MVPSEVTGVRTMNSSCVLQSFELLECIARYFSAEDIARACLVNKTFRQVCRHDTLWQQLCDIYGFKSLTSVTKTRGVKSYKSIYIAALCIECRSVDGNKGNVVIDTNGGNRTRMGGVDGPTNSLVSLCSDCFASVQAHGKVNDRMRFALQRCKRRLSFHVWATLLNKIPFKDICSRKRRARSQPEVSSGSKKRGDRFEDPGHNDYLLKLLHK